MASLGRFMYVTFELVYNNIYRNKTLFNSCERLLLGTLISGQKSSRISDLSFGLFSDLIHGIMENGLRHTSGPVHAKHPLHILMTTTLLFQVFSVIFILKIQTNFSSNFFFSNNGYPTKWAAVQEVMSFPPFLFLVRSWPSQFSPTRIRTSRKSFSPESKTLQRSEV